MIKALYYNRTDLDKNIKPANKKHYDDFDERKPEIYRIVNGKLSCF